MQDHNATLDALMTQINAVWEKLFPLDGKAYVKASWILHDTQVSTPCGDAPADAAPFYCPKDSKIYAGTGFFDQIAAQIPDPETAKFVLGSVLAHETGHHVQFVLGTGEANEAKRKALQADGKVDAALELSRHLELQADFYSGIWAHTALKAMSDTQIKAAYTVTDKLAHAFDQNTQHVQSHGTGDERMHWFDKGAIKGRVADGDALQLT